MQTEEEIKINDNVSLLVENPVDFKNVYLIYSENTSILSEGKIEVKATDRVEKQVVNISLNTYPYKEGYVIEDNNLYYKKLLVSSLLEDFVEFQMIKMSIDDYKTLLYS